LPEQPQLVDRTIRFLGSKLAELRVLVAAHACGIASAVRLGCNVTALTLKPQPSRNARFANAEKLGNLGIRPSAGAVRSDHATPEIHPKRASHPGRRS
jgi:hypothetical protein